MVVIWICEVLLYLIQCFVLLAGYAILTSYLRMVRARPTCISQ